MDKPSANPNSPLAARPGEPASQTGYCKPPVANRFVAGKSGNLKGRPKGKNKLARHPPYERLKEIILEEAYRTIKVNDCGKQVTVPMAQAIMRSLAVTAAKGNTKAQRLFAELLASSETSHKRANDELFEKAITYKHKWEGELERRARFGIIAPDPIPHPDDVNINPRNGTISIHGPMTKEDLADLDLWLNRKNDNEEELKVIMEDLKDPEYTPHLEFINYEIFHTKQILQIIDKALAMRASPASIKRRLSQLNLTMPDYLLKLKALEQTTV